MTDTFQVQGDFAPAESFVATDAVAHSAIDAVAAIAAAAAATAPVVAVSDEADDVAVTDKPNGFIAMGLAPELVQAVADLGYTPPTSVQDKAIPLVMGAGAEGRRFIHLMVSTQTARGNTSAILLPVVHTPTPPHPEAEAEARQALAVYEREEGAASLDAARARTLLARLRLKGIPLRPRACNDHRNIDAHGRFNQGVQAFVVAQNTDEQKKPLPQPGFPLLQHFR